MTILPNKKLKPSSSKEETGRDRKRPRTSPYPPTGPNINHERTKKHHPSTSGLQKSKGKLKSRRPDGKLVEVRESYTPPRSPLAQVRVPPVLPGAGIANVSEAEAENSGYNSEDEYDKRANYSEERECEFKRTLREKRGFEIVDVEADGACLFRSVSDQIYGDEGMHDIIRAKCCDYMELNADYFRDWVTEDFASYIGRKRLVHTHGNHIELQAMSEQYGRLFEIYEYNHIPIKTFQCSDETDNPPIRLSYHNGNHYNSVRDPYRATIGVGLGIPHANQGVANRSMFEEALAKSEIDDTEARMLLDKAKHTDYQATDQALLASVARESLQEFYKKSKKPTKAAQSLNRLSSTSSSTSLKPSTSRIVSPPRIPSPELRRIASPPTNREVDIEIVKPAPVRVEVVNPPSRSPINDEPGPSHQSQVSTDPQWALSDWVTENDEESVLEAILQQSAQDFYKKH